MTILTAKVLVIPQNLPDAATAAEAVVLVRRLAVVQIWNVGLIVVTKVPDLYTKTNQGVLN